MRKDKELTDSLSMRLLVCHVGTFVMIVSLALVVRPYPLMRGLGGFFDEMTSMPVTLLFLDLVQVLLDLMLFRRPILESARARSFKRLLFRRIGYLLVLTLVLILIGWWMTSQQEDWHILKGIDAYLIDGGKYGGWMDPFLLLLALRW